MEQQNSIAIELGNLLERYRLAYQNMRSEAPQAECDSDWLSPCLSDELKEGEFGEWRAVKREPVGVFNQVEEAMSVALSSDAEAYWSSYYSANITIDSEAGILELLLPWNEEDYLRFQQNLVGHLLTQQRFKLPLTTFIGVELEGERVVAVDEQGAVWLEIPGRKNRQRLSDSLSQFLAQAQPVILPE